MTRPANPADGTLYPSTNPTEISATVNGIKVWNRYVPGAVAAGTGPVTVNNGVVSVDAPSTSAFSAAITAAGGATATALAAAQAAQASADDKVSTSALGVSVATLTSGKLTADQIPSITTNDTEVVASEAAMLALALETGDVAVRTDLNKSFILRAMPPTTLANWQELLSPASLVQSIAGRTGAVTLTTADVGGLATVAATGAYSALTGAPRIPKVWTTTPDNTAVLGDEYHAGGAIYNAITNSAGTGLDWVR